MKAVLAAAVLALVPAVPAADASGSPCVAALTQSRADLDRAGLAISRAQKQLAVILLASRGRLTRSELVQAVAVLEQLDRAATSILPDGPAQRGLARRAASCRSSLAPSA